ncbi:MAG: alpha/beta hydrolase [Pseudomonadaceae bacterium]|nr:alpha/beta hydrolase [Pseudomonadaceae bacterium]
MYDVLDVQDYRSHGPSLLHSMFEAPRMAAELASFATAYPLLRRAPRGDGHPVLVLPGFLAGDDSTAVLRRYLNAQGYRALPWLMGRNNGSQRIQQRLGRRFMRLIVAYKGGISLIGQSLGGVFARELAREFPEHVRQVITLGSPFGASGADNTHPVVGNLFERVSGQSVRDMKARLGEQDSRAPIPVPSTAVYSKSDGVVHWSSCLEYHGPQSQNIEIIGSHCGMTTHPGAVYVMADRLAQPANEWQHFIAPARLRQWLLPKAASPGTHESNNPGEARQDAGDTSPEPTTR